MKNNKDIAVIGCRPFLPDNFPLEMPENSGNMIHAIAPLKIFENANHNLLISKEYLHGDSFVDYVNNRCSHLVITLANTIRMDKQTPESYERLHKSLKRYNVPIVVFGFGIQAKTEYDESSVLCDEAKRLIEFLSEKSVLLGVRGEKTKQIIEKNTNATNVYVTGCPSLFSNSSGLLSLKLNWKKLLDDKSKKVVVNVTNLQRESEVDILTKGIISNAHLIEPVSRITHQYHLDLSEKYEETTQVPYYLKNFLKGNTERLPVIKDFYLNNYSLFRNVDDWFEFNRSSVSFTVGTRFHVNMASILSGVPALWLIHDARTYELADYFKLPSLPLELAQKMSLDEISRNTNYDEFFDNLPFVLNRFNYYLSQNGLPKIINYYQ